MVWKWIEEKFDIQWMYLLCFIFVDTAFFLCGADLCWVQTTSSPELNVRCDVIWRYVNLTIVCDADINPRYVILHTVTLK